MPKRRAVPPAITGYVAMTYQVHEEDGQWVSACLELGTASCGDTVDEAFKNIHEATIQYLNAIEESGDRERIFRKRNIPIYPVKPEEKRLVPVGGNDVVSSAVIPLTGLIGAPRGKTPAML